MCVFFKNRYIDTHAYVSIYMTYFIYINDKQYIYVYACIDTLKKRRMALQTNRVNMKTMSDGILGVTSNPEPS